MPPARTSPTVAPVTSRPRARGLGLPSASQAGPTPTNRLSPRPAKTVRPSTVVKVKSPLTRDDPGDVEHRAGEREGEDATRVRRGLGGTERDLERPAVEHHGSARPRPPVVLTRSSASAEAVKPDPAPAPTWPETHAGDAGALHDEQARSRRSAAGSPPAVAVMPAQARARPPRRRPCRSGARTRPTRRGTRACRGRAVTLGGDDPHERAGGQAEGGDGAGVDGERHRRRRRGVTQGEGAARSSRCR